jgi:hypothetical protein
VKITPARPKRSNTPASPLLLVLLAVGLLVIAVVMVANLKVSDQLGARQGSPYDSCTAWCDAIFPIFDPDNPRPGVHPPSTSPAAEDFLDDSKWQACIDYCAAEFLPPPQLPLPPSSSFGPVV